MKKFLETRLKEVRAQNLHRSLRQMASAQGALITIDGRRLHNFSSNDYLGLAADPELKGAAAAAIRKFGTGAGASRLISGNLEPCAKLECDLARFKRAEAALVFASGYAAALGTITSLVGPGDVVILDKLCHACIIDACRQSGATVRVYPHLNLKKLRDLLAWASRNKRLNSNVLIVTETVFSMDGDVAPLADIADLKNAHGAWLMIDEAHATGVFGKTGRGLAEHFGVENEIEVTMGTLGKALGSAGGYINGSRALIDFLVNHARSFIFSTGMPPASYAAASAALKKIRQSPALRKKLWDNVAFFCARLGRKPISPIVPIQIGAEARTLEVSRKLWEAGFFVPAIRYPTVARGRARLRISISAAHSKKQLEQLIRQLQQPGLLD
jgi:8-amino-7-oxononanoate synthase